MKDNTNICDNRITYDYPDDLSERETEIYRRAIRRVENALSVIADLQDNRVTEANAINRPLTPVEIHTLVEMNDEHLMPSLAVLKALEEQT